LFTYVAELAQRWMRWEIFVGPRVRYSGIVYSTTVSNQQIYYLRKDLFGLLTA